MKRNLTSLAVVAAIYALIYAAFVANAEGALNALRFYVWFMSLMSLTLLSDKSIRTAALSPQLVGPLRFLWGVAHWSLLGLLVWNGYCVTGLAWLLGIAIIYVYRDAVQAERTRLKDRAS